MNTFIQRLATEITLRQAASGKKTRYLLTNDEVEQLEEEVKGMGKYDILRLYITLHQCKIKRDESDIESYNSKQMINLKVWFFKTIVLSTGALAAVSLIISILTNPQEYADFLAKVINVISVVF